MLAIDTDSMIIGRKHFLISKMLRCFQCWNTRREKERERIGKVQDGMRLEKERKGKARNELFPW